jgi:hypothetical protein
MCYQLNPAQCHEKKKRSPFLDTALHVEAILSTQLCKFYIYWHRWGIFELQVKEVLVQGKHREDTTGVHTQLGPLQHE